MAHELGALSEKRRRWVEVNRENGFDEGIKRLLTELYPDNAHFIYELLQNAEDTQAQEVRFILYDDYIEFEHNGKKLFSLEDVTAITSIGSSTKRDDATNIGKFGVGFKAVFAYTNTPQIQSGVFSFQIQDMVVPERVSCPTQASHDEKTRVTLPFDNPQKLASHAKNEIETLLRALDATTLLFLTNIRKIEYLLPDLSLGYIERIDLGNSQFEIRVQQPKDNEPSSSYFLVFDKEVQVEEEETGASGQRVKNCRIAAAFGIVPAEGKNEADQTKGKKVKNKAKWEIVPMTPGSACIYFPADKETSNLRFHLHAPFASTVARDSVRDCAGNNALRDHLAELIAESMHKIRDQGLLNASSLAILPNDRDSLTTFYQPFLTRLVKEFKEQDLVPMKRGDHAAASGVFRGQRTLSDLINDDDLVTLLGDDYYAPMWVANPPQRNQREDNFLSGLNINEWDADNLTSALIDLDDKDRAQWMCKKDDAWHQKLYAYLEESSYKLKSIEIVKISDGTYREGGECFFPTEETISDKRFPRVTKGAYLSGKNENKAALNFLKAVGVREVDEGVEIEGILNAYYGQNTERPSIKEHYSHLRRFLQFLDANPHKSGMFQSFFIFKIGKEEKASLWGTPNSTYLDVPFKTTGLHTYYKQLDGESEEYPLVVEYKRSGIKPEKLGEFAEKVGAATKLPIRRTRVDPYSHPDWDNLSRRGGDRCTSYSISEDYQIPSLDSFFQQPSINKSALLWQTIESSCNEHDWKYSKAHYGRNLSNRTSAQSTLVHSLRITRWVPQKNNETVDFVKPCDAVAEKLPTGFVYRPGRVWLLELKFGINIEKNREAQKLERERQTAGYKRKEEVAKEMGFNSSEEAMELARSMKEDPEGCRRWLDSRKKTTEFPSRPVANPERRQEHVEEQVSTSPTKNYETRNRSVRTSAPDSDPAIWLRNQYTDNDGRMFCQICKDVLPFKKRNMEYYFEKKEILSRDYLPKEYVAQYVALCPLHAAMYEELIKKDDEAMVRLKEDIANADNCEIPILLNGEKTSIRFVEAHIHDLKIIIDDLE